MAVSKKTAEAAKGTNTTDAVGRRKATKGEPQFANYAGKNVPTRIQEYADWLTRETGYDVDVRSVYLGSALRGTFQKSDENQERIKTRAEELVALKAARAQAKIDRAAAKEARKAERAAKAEEAAAAKVESDRIKAEAKAAKAAEPKVEKAPKAAAKKAPTKAAAKTPAKPATPSRRRPAAKKETDGDF